MGEVDRQRYGAVWIKDHPVPHVVLVHRGPEDLEKLPAIGTYYHESAVRELVQALRDLHMVTYFPKGVTVPDHRTTLQTWEALLTHYKDLLDV